MPAAILPATETFPNVTAAGRLVFIAAVTGPLAFAATEIVPKDRSIE